MKEKETKEPKKTRKSSKMKEDKIEKKIEIEEPEVREVVVERKVGFNYAEVIVIMIITLILGGVIGSFITYVMKGPSGNGKTVITEIPRELKEFVTTYNDIISDYYEEIDSNELLESGIKGMLEYLGDDYSFYMDEEESESFNQEVEGKYQGVGIEITQQLDGRIQITKVFDNTPAQREGLKVGDYFVSVNGEKVEGLTPNQVSNKIKDSQQAEITVLREDKEFSFTLSIEEVEIESVESKTFEKNGKKIGYLSLSTFAANTFPQFEKKLLELEGQKIDSLVIDVRDNSGGYLSTVTDIASLFMNKSKVIYQLDTKGVVEKVFSNTNTSRNYQIAVLINGNSASASEILAAALQESYGAKVIGMPSFGKGTVQKAYQLESGATVKYTIQKWLTPDGNWINEKGVTPNIELDLTDEYYQNPSDETDNQLQRALEEVSK